MRRPSQKILDYINNEERLPAYNKTRELFQQFELSTKKAPINIKRGIIARIEQQLMDIMLWLAFAEDDMQNLQRRLELINSSQDTLREVRLSVRMLKDLGFIKKPGWSALMLFEDDLAGQLYAWKRDTEKCL